MIRTLPWCCGSGWREDSWSVGGCLRRLIANGVWSNGGCVGRQVRHEGESELEFHLSLISGLTAFLPPCPEIINNLRGFVKDPPKVHRPTTQHQRISRQSLTTDCQNPKSTSFSFHHQGTRLSINTPFNKRETYKLLIK